MNIPKPVKIGLALILIAAFAWAAKLAMDGLTKGTLVIESTKGAELFLVDAAGREKKVGRGTAELKLKPGLHFVSSRLDKLETRAVATVIKQQRTTSKLPLKALAATEKVNSYSAYQLIEQGGQLRFLNKAVREINQLQAGEFSARPVLQELFPVMRLQWSSFSSGIAQLEDQSLYFFNEKGVQPLLLPERDDEAGPVAIYSYSINQRNEIVLILDNQLYHYASPSAEPTVVTSVEEGSEALLSNRQKILVYNPTIRDAHDSEPEPESAVIYDISNGNKETVSLGEGKVTGAAWDSNGNLYYYQGTTLMKLLAEDKNDPKTILRDVSNPDSLLPTGDEIYLIDDGSIWVTGTGAATISYKLAELQEPVLHGDPLALSSSGEQLYYGSSPAAGLIKNASIYRVRLR